VYFLSCLQIVSFFKLWVGGVKSVNLIREVVQQAINTGYLTLEAEERLRFLLRGKYEQEDFEAFVALQHAAMLGQVKQESRELLAASKV